MKNRRTQSDMFTVRIKGDMRARIRSIAQKLERSEAWIVRTCVKKKLDELENQRPFNVPDLQAGGEQLLAA